MGDREKERKRERERERERARARVWCIEMTLKEENRILEFHCLKWEQLLKVWSIRGERGGIMVLEILKWFRSRNSYV